MSGWDDIHDLDDPNGERRRHRALAEVGRAMAQLQASEDARPKRPALPVEEPMPFLATSVADRVFSLIERCICMRGNGLAIGAPGVGKTMALTEALRSSDALEGPEVAVLKVEPSYGASAMVLLEEFAPLLGVSPAHSVAATVRRLKRDVVFRPLVVFDEAQNLSLRIVHQLLSIAEDAAVRMLFVGNPESVKLVSSGLADVRLISRRLPYRIDLSGISDADADLVAGHLGVDDMDGIRACRAIGAVFHVDGIVQVLKEARRRRPCGTAIRSAEIAAALDAFPHIRDGLASSSATPIPFRLRTAGAARLISSKG